MSELVALYDENGNITSTITTRDIIHKLGLWHKTVHCWLYDSNRQRFVVQRRAATCKAYPNKWDGCTGHVGATETSKEAAIREIKEELGLTVLELNLLLTAKVSIPEYHENTFVDVYLGFVDTTTMTIDPMEVAEVKLITHQELYDHYVFQDPEFVLPDPDIITNIFRAINQIHL
jgi:isopentenyldiphosphate isomerase